MMLLSRLKTMTTGLSLLALLVAAGWTSTLWMPAHAATPVEEPAAQPRDDPRSRATSGPAESRKAEFVFQRLERDRKSVSLVIAGTSAPVLSLPIREGLRVVAGGRRVGIDRLPTGVRVAIRLDSSNRVIEEIRMRETRRCGNGDRACTERGPTGATLGLRGLAGSEAGPQ